MSGCPLNIPTLRIAKGDISYLTHTRLKNDLSDGLIFYDVSDKKLFFYNDQDIPTWKNIIINDLSNIDLSKNVNVHGNFQCIENAFFDNKISMYDISLKNIHEKYNSNINLKNKINFTK